jgi:hypothetical protein
LIACLEVYAHKTAHHYYENSGSEKNDDVIMYKKVYDRVSISAYIENLCFRVAVGLLKVILIFFFC